MQLGHPATEIRFRNDALAGGIVLSRSGGTIPPLGFKEIGQGQSP
mgnify:CR=1 FL=1